MSTTTDTEQYGMDSLGESWRTLALAGGVVGLIGLLAMVFPFVSGLSIAFALGVLLVIGGIVHGVHAFTVRGWTGSLWQVTLGVVSLLAGVILLVNPIVGLASLTILVIAYLFVDGVAELATSLRMGSQTGRGWIAASGAISLVLAALLWVGFPATAAWAVGLLVGVGLFTTGLSMVFVAFAGRGTEEEVSPPAAEPRGA